jgi:glycosyltransferase involved in cell wall biosynthesis
MLSAAPFEIVWEKSADSKAQITVAISCYRYGKEATEALATLLLQTEPQIDIVLVDDHSPDDSAAVVGEWLSNRKQDDKFGNVRLVRHLANQGLSQTRNTALSLSNTPYTFILDADNQVYPRALEALREALENSGYAMAYSLVEKFGLEQGIIDNSVWIPEKFSYGNYIDAMTLVRTELLRELGGYRHMPNKFGWEDYDLWCSFVDRNLKGCHVPQILCRYRVHKSSMLRNVTNNFVTQELERVRADFEAHHKMSFHFLSDRDRRSDVLRRALRRSGSQERIRLVRALCNRLPIPIDAKHALTARLLGYLKQLEAAELFRK